MKKLRRILGIVLSVMMVLFILSACSGSKTDGTTSKPAGTSSAASAATTAPVENDKPATLRFMWWGGDSRHEATLAMIDTYMDARPNITVEGEYSGWDGYEDKLTTQLASGTAADVMQVSYSWLHNLQRKGGVFENFLNHPQLINLDMFSENVLDSYCNVDGAIVALPAGASGNIFLVNRNTLEKAGVPLDIKWTWDDLLEAAKKVRALGDDYYLTMDGDKNVVFMSYFYQMIRGITGNNLVNDDFTVGFTRDEAIKALSFIKTLDENRAWPSMSEVSLSGASDRASDPRWIDGKTAACMSQWVSSFLGDFEAMADSAGDVQSFPVFKDGKDPAVMVYPSMHLCAYSKGENVEESVKLLNYMFTDEEAVKALGTSRGIPSSSIALQIAEANDLVATIVAKALNLANENATEIPFSPYEEDSELGTLGADILEMMLFDRLTPEAAADEIIAAYNTRLEEMKEEYK